MKLSISLPDPLGSDIRAKARERGISVSAYVAELVRAEQRRRSMDQWSAEVLAESPPTEADIADVRAALDRARSRTSGRRATG